MSDIRKNGKTSQKLRKNARDMKNCQNKENINFSSTNKLAKISKEFLEFQSISRSFKHI